MQTTIEQATSITRDGVRGKLYFYGDIVSSWYGAWDNTDQYPERIREFLTGQTGPLDIYINSGGGNVFACMAIYNMLARYPNEKVVYVDGLAASAASVIALVGDKVIIPENAFLMIHHAWAHVTGNVYEVERVAAMLKAIDDAMVAVYEQNAKVEREKIVGYMDEDKYFTGREAAEVFQKISVAPAIEMVARAEEETLARFRQVPESLREARLKAQAAVQVERERLALLELKGD